jgi:hypothetical protein
MTNSHDPLTYFFTQIPDFPTKNVIEKETIRTCVAYVFFLVCSRHSVLAQLATRSGIIKIVALEVRFLGLCFVAEDVPLLLVLRYDRV